MGSSSRSTQFKSLLLIWVLISSNYTSSIAQETPKIVHDEVLVVTNTWNTTEVELYNIEENGKYRTLLHLLDRSLSTIFFEIVFSHSGFTNHKNVTYSDNREEVNGTLRIGEQIEFSHNVSECVSDTIPGEYIVAKALMNNTKSYLQLRVIVDEFGRDRCGPQLGPPPIILLGLNFITLVILLGFVIFGIYYVIKRLRKWQVNSEQYPKP